MYYENIFKEKRTADYNVYTFSLFSTKFATHEPPPPPPPVKRYIMCVLYISVRNRVYCMFMCVLHFRVRNRVAPP